MNIHQDTMGQPYVQWRQATSGIKRAWIQRRTDPVKDWAGTGRYLNVVRCTDEGNPAIGDPSGNPTDFPIYSDSDDAQILLGFVEAVSRVTGAVFPPTEFL